MKGKAILILLCLLCAFTGNVSAQRTLPRMRGVEIRGGMVDGFHSASQRNKLGYYVGAGLTSYARHANKWVYGAEYLCRQYPYKEAGIPVAQFTAEGGYYYNFLSDASKTFFFYLGGSAMLGYETVNWGVKGLDDGATIRNADCFLYGGAITLQVDAYLSDRVVLQLSARERILWGTKISRFHTLWGMGLMFIIN